MLNIFNTPEIEHALTTDGYIVLPFLSPEELENFSNTYSSLHPQGENITTCSVLSPDVSYKMRISEMVKSAYQPKLEKLFTNFKPLFFGTLITKGFGKDPIIFECHQDPTHVDEENYRSYNVWVPIIDVNEHNGAMWVWPGSHNFFNNIRNSNPSPHYFFEDVKELVWDKMKLISMKAGEAIIYDHKLVHGSKHNFSDMTRPAFASSVFPNQTDAIFYYYDTGIPNNHKLEKFILNESTFFEKDSKGLPLHAQSIGSIDYELKSIPREEFITRFN